ncbi:GAP family protein [Gaiella sp.]|jgi:threonine/homoserine/homoserine lactone efflux protein|uniref:GAP family protein n=1 Tax=Gaiella sp. TaxID=2663207 RepID=UPI002E2EAEB1|nr:GAP family protein [Gaiella sp.]HEX5584415.1 GAP family protein [Gaiella sp.]
MAHAIGQLLSLAVGVALSPLPIIAVTVMLTTSRARANGPAFVGGWLVGLAVVGVVVLLVAQPTNANDGGEPATWVDVLKIVLGVLVLRIALRQWRGRPREGEEPPTPKWMGAIDAFTPAKAAGAGAVLAGANPKNLMLAVAAAAAIAQTGIPGGQQAGAYAVFAVIGTVGVGAPVAIYFALGDRSGPILDRLGRWMGTHNAVIIGVLCLVIGAKLIGDGIAGLG